MAAEIEKAAVDSTDAEKTNEEEDVGAAVAAAIEALLAVIKTIHEPKDPCESERQ